MLACTPCMLEIVQDLTKTEKVLSNRTFCFNFSSLWQNKLSAKKELSFTLEKVSLVDCNSFFIFFNQRNYPLVYVLSYTILPYVKLCATFAVQQRWWVTSGLLEGTSVNHAKLRPLLSSEGFCWVDFLCCFREATPKNDKIWKIS